MATGSLHFPGPQAKVVFANQLRGMAAWAVLYNHLMLVYWGLPEVVSPHTGSPVREVARPWISTFEPTAFYLGASGVAVFFLISGFVIPYSLKNFSDRGFLVARALRLYPVYVALLVVQVLVVWASSAYWGRPFPFTAEQLISNALLFHEELGQPTFDTVNWTLAIEIKFYIAAAIFRSAILSGQPSRLLAFAAVTTAVSLYFNSRGWYSGPIRNIVLATQFINFMFIGTLFHMHIKKMISSPQLAFYTVGLGSLFVVASYWGTGYFSSNVTPSYAYAFGVFLIAYTLRGRFRPSRLLDWAAATSYPLYVVHALVGYSVMQVLVITFGAHWMAAFLSAVAITAAIAQLAHKWIELPSIDLGRKAGKRVTALDNVRLADWHHNTVLRPRRSIHGGRVWGFIMQKPDGAGGMLYRDPTPDEFQDRYGL